MDKNERMNLKNQKWLEKYGVKFEDCLEEKTKEKGTKKHSYIWGNIKLYPKEHTKN